MTIEIGFTLNEEQVTANVDPATPLLTLIRESFGLTGTKEGCNEGECGACTVLVDGKPVDSCIYAAVQADGRVVLTVEGVHRTVVGTALIDAFLDAGGVQCGFCTPGFVVTLAALLEHKPKPEPDQVRHALVGNICRCTGYSQILDAVALAVSQTEVT